MSYNLLEDESLGLMEADAGFDHPTHDLQEDDEQELSMQEEANLEALAEAFMLAEETKIIRLNKESQIANLTGRSALILARRAKDPLFAKYAKFNSLRLQIKKQIQKKYASKALQYGRKLYANAQRNKMNKK